MGVNVPSKVKYRRSGHIGPRSALKVDGHRQSIAVLSLSAWIAPDPGRARDRADVSKRPVQGSVNEPSPDDEY